LVCKFVDVLKKSMTSWKHLLGLSVPFSNELTNFLFSLLLIFIIISYQCYIYV
jgi:hypothetical protein